MKHIILIFVSLTALTAMAQISVGDSHIRDLKCGAVRDKNTEELVVGVSYTMKCEINLSLPPQYSLVGCALYSTAVYPGAVPEKIEMQQKMQTDESVYMENSQQRIEIMVQKNPLKATVTFNDREEMNCSADRQPN